MQRRGGAQLNCDPPVNSLLLLVLRVVILPVNPLALAMLLAIDLAALLWRELSTVGFAFGLDFVMNRSLLLLQACGLSRREGAILHAFPDPFLLVPLPLIDLVLCQHVAHATQ